jgi:hypothetical protein
VTVGIDASVPLLFAEVVSFFDEVSLGVPVGRATAWRPDRRIKSQD